LGRELIKKTSDDDRRIFDPREVTLSRKSKEREARGLRPWFCPYRRCRLLIDGRKLLKS
jgi:hypothetical protein